MLIICFRNMLIYVGKENIKIDYIEFATTIDAYKQKWYNKARNKFIKLNIICLLSSILFDIVFELKMYYSSYD